MKSFKDLIVETLQQRSIVDNRQVVDVKNVTPSVLIAFEHACGDMRDMYNWIWNLKEITYVTQEGRSSYPMPYGIVKGLVLMNADGSEKCPLEYVHELTATQGCPTQWSQDWQNEEIIISPAEKDADHQMVIKYYDKNIAYYGNRSDENYLPYFDVEGDIAPTTNQFLNVPQHVYDAYAKCVVTLTRVYLNEGAQPSVLAEQKVEFNTALNSLLEFAKTPFYKAQRFEI